MLLTKTEILLGIEDGAPVNHNMGSLMQGALMERIDPAYAELLHRSELKPYSQYLTYRDGTARWVVFTLTEEAARSIGGVLLDPAWTSVLLTQKNRTFPIKERAVSRLTAEELFEQTFFVQCPRTVSVAFLTPTAFKTDGRYQNYPTVRHMFQSLVNRYNAVSDDTELPAEDTLESILGAVSVTRYDLHSTYYGVEGVRIPAFQGRLTMRLSGPQQLVNLIHMLLRFGTCSGVGIKTAMGMGAFRIIEKVR